MTSKQLPDVDLDVADRVHALEGLVYTPASQMDDKATILRKHNSGVFFQKVPVDPITKLCALPSGDKGDSLANKFGFAKIDVLHNTAYHGVRSPEHLKQLLAKPVPWEMFEREDIVTQLSQIRDHFDLVYGYQPRSIEDLACVIALIRPAKKHLIGEEMAVVRREVWTRPSSGYFFKKSHAIAFAIMIVVQLQVLLEVGEGPKFVDLETC